MLAIDKFTNFEMRFTLRTASTTILGNCNKGMKKIRETRRRDIYWRQIINPRTLHSSDGCFRGGFRSHVVRPIDVRIRDDSPVDLRTTYVSVLVYWLHRCARFGGCKSKPFSGTAVPTIHPSLFRFCSDWSLLSRSYKRTPSLALFISNLSNLLALRRHYLSSCSLTRSRLTLAVWRGPSFVLRCDASTCRKSFLSLSRRRSHRHTLTLDEKLSTC